MELGVVQGKGCCAAKDAIIAELTNSEAVAVRIPKAPTPHINPLSFLLTNNDLTSGIRNFINDDTVESYEKTCTMIL
jgi:hypothetical protein